MPPIPEDPYSIEGTVIINKAVAASLTVTIQNLTRSTSATCATNDSGQYWYDDIGDSVLQTEEGDSILVSLPDGACQSFTASTPEEKVVDFTNQISWVGLWKVTITPTGDVATSFQSGDGILSTIGFSLQTNSLGSFEFVIINDAGAYNSRFDIGDMVEIWLDSDSSIVGTTKRFKGSIKNVVYERSGYLNQIRIKGFGYLEKFKRTIVNEIFEGEQTYDSILASLLATYAPSVSASGIQTTGKSLADGEFLRFNYVDLFEAITKIQEAVGDWVFDVTPESVLSFKPRGSVDKGLTLYDFDDVAFEYDDTNLVNRLYVFGAQDSHPQAKTAWVGTASDNNGDAALAYDNDYSTGWDSGVAQDSGQWYKLDMGGELQISTMFLNNSTYFPTKYPRNFIVSASTNDTNWDTITTTSANTYKDIIINFSAKPYRYIKISINGSDAATWAIGEINIYTKHQLMCLYEDAESQAIYGLYEKTIRDSSLDTKGEVFERDVNEIEKNAAPVLSGSVSIAYLFLAEPGDLVNVNVPETAVNQKLAIEKISYFEGTQGSFREQIDFRSV